MTMGEKLNNGQLCCKQERVLSQGTATPCRGIHRFRPVSPFNTSNESLTTSVAAVKSAYNNKVILPELEQCVSPSSQPSREVTKSPSFYRRRRQSVPDLRAPTADISHITERHSVDMSVKAIKSSKQNRKVKSLPNIITTPLIAQSHHFKERDSRPETEKLACLSNSRLPMLRQQTSLISSSSSSVGSCFLNDRQDTIYIVAPDKDIDDDSSNITDTRSSSPQFYSRKARLERQSSYQTNTLRLPCIIPPLNATNESPKPNKKIRIHAHLVYGCVNDEGKAKRLPQSVLAELKSDYGHMARTEVVVVRENNEFSIHSRPLHRTTSNGFLLTHSTVSSELDDDGDNDDK